MDLSNDITNYILLSDRTTSPLLIHAIEIIVYHKIGADEIVSITSTVVVGIAIVVAIAEIRRRSTDIAL